ncbi:hypothetical protein OJAV_G00168350 [Oryzias javanicus]|uniref:Acyl-CoA thioester hydrolase/bile acid-CoA amino acid N-acetyltransferase domain-containing protein n=1 Tax=Oryzias javanicus TaxID=123683 RepID=A0A3S2U2G1_ORYJA|nr:hypothetical protein OJAV_G00168350 [Oryzias javanicus]
MSSQIRLRLLPSARCLYDEPIQVKVSHLKSRQVVTIKASSTDEKGVVFRSSAAYRGDGNGEIDLVRDASLSGSYVGVEPMGLLRTLKPETLNTIFIKDKASEPHMVKFSVHDDEEQDLILAEATNERLLMADGVSRLPVKEGNFHGVLFTPPGKGPFPAVLDLCTIPSERRAALLANKGFVVLTLSVFQEKFGNLKMLHLDPLEEAMIFLLQQPKVGSKRIGVVSYSKSADVALSLAAFVPGVEAVVWISGCSANTVLPLFYKKRQILPALTFDSKKLIPTQSGAFIGKYAVHDPLKEENRATVVPIEQANTHFLFVAPEDDLCWDSRAFMMEMVERLQRLGKKNFESVCYPKAGHYLEPPYGPFCPSSLNMFFKKTILWGGESRAHAAAEVDMWKKIQEFLKSHKDLFEKMSSQIRLRLLPSARCLYDEPIQVKVSHLKSKQVVTIKASSADEKGVVFRSSATYRADGDGEIDLVRDASLSGSYVGVEPMGLLRTLKPNTLNKLFIKDKALEPHMVKFSVYDDEEQDKILAEATNERLLMADGVSRVSVKEGNFHGVLFTPPGKGPFPGVLDLCTFMSERRAALLANKGFVVLTIPVFPERGACKGWPGVATATPG